VLPTSAHTGELAPGVRGLATRAPNTMKIDGDLSEFKSAFCTPLEYFSLDPKTLGNRAAQFFYLWDDEAFYAGLRTLDGSEPNIGVEVAARRTAHVLEIEFKLP